MRTISYSLAWKEWHEQKWKLVAITTILCGIVGLSLTFADPRDRLGLAAGLVTICMVPLAIFIGLGTAAGEASRRTLPYLQALPVPLQRVAAVKLLSGLLTVIAPIVVAVCALYSWSLIPAPFGPLRRDLSQMQNHSVTGSFFADVLVSATAIAASFYIWSAAMGVNRRDEVSAGAVALAVMIGWCLLLVVVGYAFALWGVDPPEPGSVFERVAAFAVSTAPGGFVWIAISPEHPHWPAVALGTIAIHSALIARFITLFGREPVLEKRSPKPVERTNTLADWLEMPRQSPLTAIIWKQYRESLPLVLAGIAGTIGIAMVLLLGQFHLMIHSPERLTTMFSAVSVVLGFCTATIVGIGVCHHDMSPSLNTFWRSRPIHPDAWFWTKFVTGLLVLLGAIYIPLLVILFALHPDPWRVVVNEDLLETPMLHISVFAAAVAMMCLVRHAVYAAILAIGSALLAVAAGSSLYYWAGRMGYFDLDDQYVALAEVGFATLVTVASTIIAWLAMRYDWGRKTRY